MKILFLISLIVTTSSSFAVVPLIVNGIKTTDHNPVVHLKMASKKSITVGAYTTCTGTFFKSGYIITAAHCLSDIYMEKRLSAYRYIKTGGSAIDEYETKIFINDEKVARKQSIYISKLFRKSLDQEFRPHYFVSYLEESLGKKEISVPEFQKQVQKYRELYEVLESRKFQADLAIIKVTPEKTDKYYKLDTSGVSSGDDVLMVGYGHELSALSVKRISKKINAYSVLLENGAYSKKIEKRKKALTQALKSSASLKRIGKNKIEHIKNGLIGLEQGINNRIEKDFKISSDKDRTYNKESVSSVSLGDSGGPLLFKKSGEYVIKGIASRSGVKESGNTEELMSIYIDLSSSQSKDFINDVLTGKVSAEF